MSKINLNLMKFLVRLEDRLRQVNNTGGLYTVVKNEVTAC
jgi:hypothetical protein